MPGAQPILARTRARSFVATAATLLMVVTAAGAAQPATAAGAAQPATAAGAAQPATAAGAAQPAAIDNALVNPGFEADGVTASPTGWTTRPGSGPASAAAFVEPGGYGGTGYRLTHWAAGSYLVRTEQRLTGLDNGPYTLRAWVRTDGGQAEAYVGVRDCGSPAARVPLPRTGGSDWVQVAVPVEVQAGRCTIVLHSRGNPGDWAHFDELEFTPGAPAAMPWRGGDISTLLKNEHFGAVYYDRDGTQADALTILQGHGMNYARLKVWVNPADGYNSPQRVLELAQRIKGQGLGLIVNFHYSDRWADPGQQHKPAAWSSLSFPQLRQAVYDHTYEVLDALAQQGTPADVAQLGNEINGGMLWPDGRWDNWDNLAALLRSAAAAVDDAVAGTPILLHLAEGGNNEQHRWWFDNAVARGVPFDIIGVSHYVYWHGTLGSLQANLFDLADRYGRDVAVMETAYGFTLAEGDFLPNIFNAELAAAGGYPATPAGQAAAFRDVVTVVSAVPDGRGLGVFYWEPAWTAVEGAGWDPEDPSSGNGWENQALFDYEYRALPGIEVFAGP